MIQDQLLDRLGSDADYSVTIFKDQSFYRLLPNLAHNTNCSCDSTVCMVTPIIREEKALRAGLLRLHD